MISIPKKRLLIILVVLLLLTGFSLINRIAYFGQTYTWYKVLTLKHYVPRLLLLMGFGICIGFFSWKYFREQEVIFRTKPRTIYLTLISIIISTCIFIYFYKVALSNKLLPYFPPLLIVGLLLILINLLLSVDFHTSIEKFFNPKITFILRRLLNWVEKHNIPLYLTLLMAIPLLFTSAIKQEYPIGFAGLFTLMAEGVADANFSLPMSVAFYGSAEGMPFAYPPLGFYLMAFFIKMGVSPWFYLRFAPPVFSLLALIPLFLIARKLSRTSLGGMLAAILAAGSIHLFPWQTASGGVVRGLAFCLGLFSVYYFNRTVESFTTRNAITSGVFFGLTVLTHLGYAYFFALWIGVWLLTHSKKKSWVGLGIFSLVSLMEISPWVLTMLRRYGASIFLNAFLSHDNTQVFSLFQSPSVGLEIFNELFFSLYNESWILIIALITGLLNLIMEKKYDLPILFLVVLLLSSTSYYNLTVYYLIISYSMAFSYRYECKKSTMNKVVMSVVTIILMLSVYFQQIPQLSTQVSNITSELIDVGDYLKTSTAPDAGYLALLSEGQEEEEWLIYLARRQPAYTGWGSEWMGTYDSQNIEYAQLRRCINLQNMLCINTWIETSQKYSKYIIMSTDLEILKNEFLLESTWQSVYENPRYIIWENR